MGAAEAICIAQSTMRRFWESCRFRCPMTPNGVLRFTTPALKTRFIPESNNVNSALRTTASPSAHSAAATNLKRYCSASRRSAS